MAHTTPSAARHAPSEDSTARPRVVVVDDNVDAATVLAEVLRRMGYDPSVVHDGRGTLEEAARLRPASMLVDIGLPDLDGYEVARRLRAMPGLESLQIVAVTGYGTGEDRERSHAAGFDAHLVKPVDLDALRELLRLANS